MKNSPDNVQYSVYSTGISQYSTVLYSSVQHSTAQYSTVQYSTVMYSTVLYSIVHIPSIIELIIEDKRLYVWNSAFVQCTTWIYTIGDLK